MAVSASKTPSTTPGVSGTPLGAKPNDEQPRKTETLAAGTEERKPDPTREQVERIEKDFEEQKPLTGFHDSMTGRQVTEDGRYLDGTDGQVPRHRVVANNWPDEQVKIDPKSAPVVQPPAVTKDVETGRESVAGLDPQRGDTPSTVPTESERETENTTSDGVNTK